MPDPRFESWEESVAKARAAQTEAQAVPAPVVPPPLPVAKKERSPLLPFIVGAIIAGCLTGGLIVAMIMRQGDNLPPMPGYAKRALKAKIKAHGLDDIAGLTPEGVAAFRHSKELYTKWAASMPDDPAVEQGLNIALEHFKKQEDILDVWIECLTGAGRFESDGTTPVMILHGILTTLSRLQITPEKRQNLRNFIFRYQELRQREKLSHSEAIDRLCDLRIFSNRITGDD
jgi:hypothetical protein